MEVQEERTAAALERAFHDQRAQLVRWCAHLAGNVDVAEDLVQETFSAAWRSVRRPALTEEYPAWLAGIARNICRSWQRNQRRELARRTHFFGDTAFDGGGNLDLADPFDVEEALERDELISLLDRALALLPGETRQVLVAKYVEQASLEEVARRLGISQGALAARLHRGKLVLRRTLTTDLRAEASSYGLVSPGDDVWRQTRIWCPNCGERALMGRLAPETDHFALRCPTCSGQGHADLASWQEHRLFQGLSSHRVALSRLSKSAHTFYRRGLHEGTTPCARCGRPSSVSRVRPNGAGASEMPGDAAYIRVSCGYCSATYTAGLCGLVLCHPEAQRFWRAHPRIVTLPDREIESDGRPAILTSFVSRDRTARLDIISDRETFAVRRINGAICNG
jgi:RNA polymerase sigma factor (sigma-70 family)